MQHPIFYTVLAIVVLGGLFVALTRKRRTNIVAETTTPYLHPQSPVVAKPPVRQISPGHFMKTSDFDGIRDFPGKTSYGDAGTGGLMPPLTRQEDTTVRDFVVGTMAFNMLTDQADAAPAAEPDPVPACEPAAEATSNLNAVETCAPAQVEMPSVQIDTTTNDSFGGTSDF